MSQIIWSNWIKESDTNASCKLLAMFTPVVNGNKTLSAMQKIDHVITIDLSRRIIPTHLEHLVTDDSTALDLAIISMRDIVENMQLSITAISKSPDITVTDALDDDFLNLMGMQFLPEDWERLTRELFDTASK